MRPFAGLLAAEVIMGIPKVSLTENAIAQQKRQAEKEEQRLKVELPRLDQLGGVHSEGMHDQQLVPLERVEVEAQRGDVGAYLFCRLLKGDQHAWLAMLPGARDEEMQPQQRLAGSRATRHQRRPATG